MRRTARVNTCRKRFLNFQYFNTRFEVFDKLDRSEALEYP